jgi:lipoprotein-releasing system permease protein
MPFFSYLLAMQFIYFITRRFLSARRKERGVSIFSAIAASGIALGVATLIIALSVLNGFQQLLTDKLMSLDSHIQLRAISNVKLPPSTDIVIWMYKFLGNDCNQVKPFIEKLVIAGNAGMKEGIMVKGVPSDYFSNKTNINCVEGTLTPYWSDCIVLSKTLAGKLFAKVGSTITVFALKNNKMPSEENPPIILRLKVTGIYESGIAKYDENYSFISIETASRLFGYTRGEANGFEIKLNSLAHVEKLTSALQNDRTLPYSARSIYEIHAPIFTWIELQKKPIPIVLGLIVLVAVFNIISVTLMIVLEKSKAVGVLRILGTRSGVIGQIFLGQGIWLAVTGIIIGNILALVLSYIQLQFNVITLPASIYFTSKVPLLLRLDTFLLVSGVAFIFSLLVSVLPGYIASKISPLTAIRFN